MQCEHLSFLLSNWDCITQQESLPGVNDPLLFLVTCICDSCKSQRWHSFPTVSQRNYMKSLRNKMNNKTLSHKKPILISIHCGNILHLNSNSESGTYTTIKQKRATSTWHLPIIPLYNLQDSPFHILEWNGLHVGICRTSLFRCWSSEVIHHLLQFK